MNSKLRVNHGHEGDRGMRVNGEGRFEVLRKETCKGQVKGKRGIEG